MAINKVTYVDMIHDTSEVLMDVSFHSSIKPYTVMSPKTALSIDGTLITGTMTTNNTSYYNPSLTEQVIPKGTYFTKQVDLRAVTISPSILASDIKDGVTVTVGDFQDPGRLLNITGTNKMIQPAGVKCLWTQNLTNTAEDVLMYETVLVDGASTNDAVSRVWIIVKNTSLFTLELSRAQGLGGSSTDFGSVNWGDGYSSNINSSNSTGTTITHAFYPGSYIISFTHDEGKITGLSGGGNLSGGGMDRDIDIIYAEIYVPSFDTNVVTQGFVWVDRYLQKLIYKGPLSRINNLFSYDCHRMQYIELPSTLTYIQNTSFQSVGSNDCKTTFVFHSTVPPTISSVTHFLGYYVDSIFVPSESVEAYKTHECWSIYASYIKPIPE